MQGKNMMLDWIMGNWRGMSLVKDATKEEVRTEQRE